MLIRSLGDSGPTVSVIGYGAMPLSLDVGISEGEATKTLRSVLATGVSFIDTADTYCRTPSQLHHNERLVAGVVREMGLAARDICIATKGGTVRIEKGWELDGSPERIRHAIVESHAALGGRDPIPLWQHHWPDPRYSVTSVMAVVKRAVQENLIRHVGVANYSVEQIEEALRVVRIVSVQNQLNFWRRESEGNGVLRCCEQEGLVFLPWRPMGGLGLAQRLSEIKPLVTLAERRETTPHRLVIAWLMAKSPCILPIPGSGKFHHIADCLGAENLALEPEEFDILDRLTPEDLPRRERPAAWREMPPLAGAPVGA